jgi:hypothetical protein
MNMTSLERALVAKCGLNCAVCSIRLASLAGRRDWLEHAAERFGCEPDDIYCDGCGGRVTRRWCNHADCPVVHCQRQRKHEFCKGCDEFPCALLADKRPDNLRRIHELGPEAWLAEDIRANTCPSCGKLALSTDSKCHSCGTALDRPHWDF